LQRTGRCYDPPLSNIPQASGAAIAAKAAYRCLDNDKVAWPAILEPHYAATEDRVRAAPLVLVAQDTTPLNYSPHPHTQGLGPIGTDSEAVCGLMVHATLAFTPQGTPLGRLDRQVWAREGSGRNHERHAKPLEAKESFKWVKSYPAVASSAPRCRQTRLVVMADREADIHEVFAEPAKTAHGAEWLIRAEHARNRQVLDAETAALWSLIEQQPLIGMRAILIPPREQRAARQVLLKPPQRRAHRPPVTV
jgi:hypothetical protein